jgi:CheY-like chemotaxis protein
MDNDATRAHILVCDDDHALRTVFRELLIDEGYQVTVQASLCSDLDEVARLGPDLIVLDLIFNGHPSGFEFLRQLKNDPATKSIPVLICTAAAGLTEEVLGHLTTWECASVTKPFDLDDLIATVRECLGKTEAVAS